MNAATMNLTSAKVACRDCSVHQLCLPNGIDEADLARLDGIVERPQPMAARRHLYFMGDNFRSVYVVRSGSIKTYVPSLDGVEQVTGFYWPGEIVGLEAITIGAHACSAQALERTSVCELPFSRLDALADDLRSLGRRLLQILGREIHRDQQVFTILGKPSAEQRIAAMLLNISSRLKQRGFADHEFRLSMSRHDIGSYLGLAYETVSRVFSRFQRQGLLLVEHRQVCIRDMAGLRIVAGSALAR